MKKHIYKKKKSLGRLEEEKDMSEIKQADRMSMDMQNEEMEIDLLDLFHEMMHKIWLIVLAIVLGAAISFGVTQFMITPMYTASSQIYILTKTTSVTSLADIQIGAQLTSDFALLTKSRPVVESVIDNLNLDYTYNELVGKVTTENPSGTRILKLVVSDANPERAKEIANEFAEVLAERIAYVMTTDRPKIVEEAVTPKAPSSPNLMKNMVMGALVGAVLSVGIIVMMYLLNDTIQTEEDVKKYLGLQTLAALPVEKRNA